MRKFILSSRTSPILLPIAIFLIAEPSLAQETDDEPPVEVVDQPVEAESLFGQPLKRVIAPKKRQAELEQQLADARAKYDADPENIDNIIWLGRRLAYLWRYNDAIEVYAAGIEKFPDEPRLYRHRGHRYITIRKFDLARNDLQKAAELIDGTEDEIEPDGQPNSAGIPTSSLHTNIWYHLGLAYYLDGQYEDALSAYVKCFAAAENNDMRVATWDWMYMTLRRLDRHEDARGIAIRVDPKWKILENHAYHRRLLMYSDRLSPRDLFNPDKDADLELATYGYGIGNWYLAEGDEKTARDIFSGVLKGRYWAAFGYIAAEADMKRMGVDPKRDDPGRRNQQPN